jgi:hypothetical protein
MLSQVCNATLPLELTGFELHCSKSKLEMKNNIMPVVEMPYCAFQTIKRPYEGLLKTRFQDTIRDVRTTHLLEWNKQMSRELLALTKLPWARLLKFCKMDGAWKITRDDTVIDYDWNQKIAKIMEASLITAFNNITNRFVGLRNTFDTDLKKILDNVRTEFGSKSP